MLASASFGQSLPNPLVLQPDSTQGIDAHVRSLPVDVGRDKNWQKTPMMAIRGRNWFGETFISRAFFDFRLDTFPSDFSVDSAFLELFTDPSYVDKGTGSKEIVAYLVSESWSDSTITYNNQPAVKTSVKASLKQDNSVLVQRLNVSSLVEAHVGNVNYYGFRLSYSDESPSSTGDFFFGSSNNTDPKLRPKLTIYGQIKASQVQEPVQAKAQLMQSGDYLHVQASTPLNNIKIYDINGRLIHTQMESDRVANSSLSLPSKTPGLYLIYVDQQAGVAAHKMFLR